MNYFKIIIFCFFSITTFAQSAKTQLAQQILAERGELNLEISISHLSDLLFLSQSISIDRVVGLKIWATASKYGFQRLNETQFEYEIILPKKINGHKKNYSNFTSYPTFDQYILMITGFANAYPQICHLETIGYSENGRLIPVLKISKNVMLHEAKPQFFYTSTMHGDETGGFVILLRMIDYLLSNYGKDNYVTDLVDNIEIWINPLSNPDGTYDSNGILSSPKRYNANSFDLNRNYPDPADGIHPDGNFYQKENICMMDFMKKHSFVMSANFHAGEEVLNYPWDTWGKGNGSFKDHENHADELWFEYICKEYIDSIVKYNPTSTYMKTVSNKGYIDGYKWYRISGGRQDYMTYYLNGREITIELDRQKITPEEELEQLWIKNYKSLLSYIKQVSFGFSGVITDSITGKPVKAKLTILNHDFDNSFVYSDSLTGFYQRPILKGTYNLLFSAVGYDSKQINNQSIENKTNVKIDLKLKPKGTKLDFVSSSNTLSISNLIQNNTIIINAYLLDSPQYFDLEIFNSVGQKIFVEKNIFLNCELNQIQIPNINDGIYFCKLKSSDLKTKGTTYSFKLVKL